MVVDVVVDVAAGSVVEVEVLDVVVDRLTVVDVVAFTVVVEGDDFAVVVVVAFFVVVVVAGFFVVVVVEGLVVVDVEVATTPVVLVVLAGVSRSSIRSIAAATAPARAT